MQGVRLLGLHSNTRRKRIGVGELGKISQESFVSRYDWRKHVRHPVSACTIAQGLPHFSGVRPRLSAEMNNDRLPAFRSCRERRSTVVGGKFHRPKTRLAL